MWTTTEETIENDYEESVMSRKDVEEEALSNVFFNRHSIIKYIRNNKREKKGVLVATKVSDMVIVGWSLCCSKDDFNSYFGKELAVKRGVKHYDDIDHYEIDVPESVTNDMESFIDRCERYYKDGNFPLWV